jgi:hypothetical protein
MKDWRIMAAVRRWRIVGFRGGARERLGVCWETGSKAWLLASVVVSTRSCGRAACMLNVSSDVSFVGSPRSR